MDSVIIMKDLHPDQRVTVSIGQPTGGEGMINTAEGKDMMQRAGGGNPSTQS